MQYNRVITSFKGLAKKSPKTDILPYLLDYSWILVYLQSSIRAHTKRFYRVNTKHI